jgi:hypothetical protein
MKVSFFVGAVAGVVIGVALTVATLAYAQSSALPAIPKTTLSEPATVQALSEDTFVAVKDHGDSQTVIVYKVDDKGAARLTHKARFFY